MTLSLRGKKILITREASQAKQFSVNIQRAEGIPIEVPLLKISCQKESGNRIDLSQYKWVFFTSAHGVRCFFQGLGPNQELLSNCFFATVGHKTENALKEFGYEADFIPSIYNAEVMAEEFFTRFPDANHILLVRGNLSRKLLVEELTKRGLTFETVVVYETNPYLENKGLLLNTLENEELDFLTFTSPSTVKTFMQMVEQSPFKEKVSQIPCVCIGTTTERVAKSFHFAQTVVPQTFTIEKMVECMVEFVNTEDE
ncbi:uroporphyrinogen-III synthase [Pseudogracilibacillus sp. SE30717A]|uniref:uroporphyrinogen-III synthase n=1 Tax=Pseudogracilibacillus sp. SE30717A TaxID=3098293 RepID=UPI00300DCADE